MTRMPETGGIGKTMFCLLRGSRCTGYCSDTEPGVRQDASSIPKTGNLLQRTVKRRNHHQTIALATHMRAYAPNFNNERNADATTPAPGANSGGTLCARFLSASAPPPKRLKSSGIE